MDKGKKRERNVNFSREETEKLVSLVEIYKNVIENKKSDAVTWQEKEKAWKVIEAEFNSSIAGTFRDAKHLKLKYEALKRDTRKKSSIIRAERYKTGGGVSGATPLTPVEQKVKEMILLSVEGGDSIHDSDQLDVATSEELGAVFTESIIEPVNIEVPITDTADYLINICDEHDDKVEVEPKKRPLEEQRKWADWKPKTRKHPALCQPREKRPFDKLAEGKLELLVLQKKLIEEELEEKLLKKQHENEMHKLEREEMLLKIEILKTELENKKSHK